uniref:39S ribosomal protein L46, mitochondrial-like n=1 Tax=Sinocyclocheilus grahami TaxID=75366 RepID=A0A672KPY4_SINGR
MAAPFSRLWRPLWSVRNVSASRQQWSAQNVKTAGAASPWALHGAACLQRKCVCYTQIKHFIRSDSLILLAKKDVGSQKLWLLPQIQWQTGETLRQTAERALASLPGADKKATFLGNVIQKEGSVGAKVFFFKAVLSSHKHLPLEKNSFAWVKKEELQDFLKPEYLKQVRRFIMAL